MERMSVIGALCWAAKHADDPDEKVVQEITKLQGEKFGWEQCAHTYAKGVKWLDHEAT